MRRKGDWTTNLPEEAVESLLGSGGPTGVPGGPNDRNPGQETPDTDPEVLEIMQGAPEGAADAVAPPTVFDLPGRGGKDYMSANLERAHNYQGVLTHRRQAGSDPPVPCTMLSAVHPALTNRLEDLGEMEIPVASIQGSAIKDAWPSIDSDNVQKFLDIWFETGSLDDVGDPFKVIKVGDGHWLIDGHNRFAVLRKVDPSGVIRAHVVERFPMEIPMSDPTRASAARTAGNQIYFEGEGNGEMELEEFLTLNEFEPEEAQEIRDTVSRGDTYRGGGGAAPEWFVRPASRLAAHRTASADDVQVGNVLVHIPTGKRFRLTGTPENSPNGYWTYESLDGGDAGPGWTDEELRKNLLKGNFRVESQSLQNDPPIPGEDDPEVWLTITRDNGEEFSIPAPPNGDREAWRFGSAGAHLAHPSPTHSMRRSGGSPPDHLIDERDISDVIKAHPMYSQADYTYLHDKGYDDANIVQLWDRDHAAGGKPVDWGIDPVNFTYPEDYREGGRHMLAEGVMGLETGTVTAGQEFAEGMRIVDVRQGIHGEIRAIASRDGLQFGTVRWADGTMEKDVPLHNGDFGVDTRPDEDEVQLGGMFGTPAIQNAASRHTGRAIQTGRPVQAIQNTGTPRLVRHVAPLPRVFPNGTPVIVTRLAEFGLPPIAGVVTGCCPDGYIRVRTADGEDEVPPEVIREEDRRTALRREAPANVKDHDKWEKAKKAAEDQYGGPGGELGEDRFYAAVNSIYQNMGGEFTSEGSRRKGSPLPRLGEGWLVDGVGHCTVVAVDHTNQTITVETQDPDTEASVQYTLSFDDWDRDAMERMAGRHRTADGQFKNGDRVAYARNPKLVGEVRNADDPYWILVKWDEDILDAEQIGSGWYRPVDLQPAPQVTGSHRRTAVDRGLPVQPPPVGSRWDDRSQVGPGRSDQVMAWEVVEIQYEMERILLKALDGTDYRADVSFDEWFRQVGDGELQPARS